MKYKLDKRCVSVLEIEQKMDPQQIRAGKTETETEQKIAA